MKLSKEKANILIFFLQLIPAISLALFLLWSRLFSICIPADDGMLAHAALRFLNGEIPHKDFEDPYSGLLNVFHAFAFNVWGMNSASLRYFHLSFFTITLLVFSLLIRSIYSSAVTSIVIVVFTLWGVLTYPASMPSWYMGYLAFFAGAILLVIKDNNRLGMFIAGMLLGLVTLLKINGVFSLVAAFWSIFLLTADWSNSHNLKNRSRSQIIKFLLILLTNILILMLIRKNLDASYLLYFYSPTLLFSVFLLRSGAYVAAECFINKAKTLLTGYLSVLGLACFYFIYYGGFYAFLRGVFVFPMSRMEQFHNPPPDVLLQVALLLFFFIALLFFRNKYNYRRYFFGVLALLAVALWYVRPYEITLIFMLSVSLIPHFLAISSFFLKTESGHIGVKLFWVPFSVLSVVIQYPFYDKIYVSYVFIFHVLAICFFLLDTTKQASRIIVALLLGGLLYLEMMAEIATQSMRDVTANIGRDVAFGLNGCIDSDLAKHIREHSRSIDDILAFPDSPGVYFAAGRNNPTKNIYECFVNIDYPDFRVGEYLKLIRSGKISVVVINNNPACSPRISDDIKNEIRARFTKEESFGHYQVFYDE